MPFPLPFPSPNGNPAGRRTGRRSYWRRAGWAATVIGIGFLVPAAAFASLEGPPPGRSIGSEDWPQWRGPNRDGVSLEAGLLDSWPEGGPPLAFQIEGLGEGYSTIAVADGRILTLGARNGREVILAFDAATGESLWSTPHGDAYRDGRGGGPRSVPTVVGDHAYVLGANADLTSVETATGRIIWTVNLIESVGGRNISWGVSESPLVLDGRVLASPGGRGAGFAAFDQETGDLLWTSESDEAGYASPMPVDLPGAPHVVFFSGERAAGVRPDDGTLLWSYDRASNRTANIATPVVVPAPTGAARLFLSSDYGTGGALVEITGTADGGARVRELYFTRDMRAHHATPILHDGVLYGFSGSILTALDIGTGDRLWRDRGVGKGSLTLADGRLYLFSERGDVALIEPSREGYRERGTFAFPRELRSRRNTWSHPVVAGGRLHLRDQDILLAYRVSAPEAGR